MMSRFWPTKFIMSVKDEILVMLLSTHQHIQQMLSEDNSIDLVTKLRELTDVMYVDYLQRHERDRLQLEDVVFATFGGIPPLDNVWSLHAIALRPHSVRPHYAKPGAEQCWALLQVFAILDAQINVPQFSIPEEQHDDGKHHRKRRRIAHHDGDLLSQMSSKDEVTKLIALQKVPFILQTIQPDHTSVGKYARQLREHIDHERAEIASWAMVGLARYVAIARA